VLQQNRFRWYGHVSRKDKNDLMKKCMDSDWKSKPKKRGERP